MSIALTSKITFAHWQWHSLIVLLILLYCVFAITVGSSFLVLMHIFWQ